VRIGHLAINVRDADRSRRFYLDELGMAGTATKEDWGFRLRFTDGFMFALIEGEPLPEKMQDRVHFGCDLPDADSVRQIRDRFRQAGVPEIEWTEEDGYTSVKVRDPDGYIVELAWDIQ
jgi:catechol 2,3-dioxygenase-like lactoylglutathione lyase family enzyme